VSILQLAEAVREIVNPKVKIISVDPKKIYGPLFEEANDKYPDATLATQELGWVPKHSFTDVIRDTYQYMSRMPTADLEATIGQL
jgi:nucleoside-diphosphate-sugar epimerase